MQPEKQRGKEKKKQGNVVWTAALILSVLVIATVSAVGACFYNYVHRSDCEISLYKGQINSDIKREKDISEKKKVNPVMKSQAEKYVGTQASEQAKKSAFKVKDAKRVWKTETAIDLFKAEYKNNNGTVTVKSIDGRKVVAPGTEGSYTFSLKNTSDAAADYKIWVEAKLSSNMTGAPIQTKMSGYGGWLLGDKNKWEQAEALDGVSSEDTIGSGKTAEYTVYWQWPFEREEDAKDTNMGNQSVNQEMSYTVTIYTLTAEATDTGTATKENQQKTKKKSSRNAKTGDNSQILLWVVVLGIAAGVVIFLLLLKKRKKDEKNEHEESGR